MNVSAHKIVGNFEKNLVQHVDMPKICQNMPNLANMPNQKYLCQPPPKNAKFQIFGIKIC